MRDTRVILSCLLVAAIACLTSACGLGGSNSDGEDAGASPSSPTSTAVPGGPLPTFNPTAGAYSGLTFDQAQQLVSFELVMPDPIPTAFAFVGAGIALPPAPPPPLGTAYPADATMWGEPTRVGFGFQPASGEEQALVFYESSSKIGHGPGGDGSPLTVGNTQVMKFNGDNDAAGTLVSYYWEVNGLYFSMTASIGPQMPITEQDLEELIAATVGE